jgi:hypothetical protein
MSKLKNIIKQLSSKDFISIYDSLIESNAEKSGYLLKFMREKQLSDAKIMEELGVNSNAYYTLRSRLNQKIEEYLLQQMESPRTTLLKKVATINEIIFTKKKAIAIATLRKLEKELLDYDLSNELTIVYKTLKKLQINTPDHFSYSQLYNRHVAYMLALDKAEDLLAEYFKKYGNFFLTNDETEKLGLVLLRREIENVANLYQSHRLYVYQNCINIFHRLYVEPDASTENKESTEETFEKIQNIFDSYYLDSIYYHLKLVFEFLKLEYYTYFNVYRKAEKYFEDVNEQTSTLLGNYNLYTFTSKFLLTKTERHLRANNENLLYEENKLLFEDYEIDKNDIPSYVIYVTYRSLSCYYADKYSESARWINNLLNELSLKKTPYAQLEIKLFLALQYCLMEDGEELFNQLINSIQRQVRLLGKQNCQHILLFTKILKTSLNETKKSKPMKIQGYINKLKKINPPHFSPLKYIKLDEDFISKLS